MLIQPFHPKGTPGTEAVVVVFDLEGFSSFFTQPDVHLYAPEYLNTVFDAVHSIFRPERPYWINEDLDDPAFRAPLREPDFTKFMGDGGIYLWTSPDPYEAISEEFKISLLQMLWALKIKFHDVVERARDIVPLPSLPSRIRFGVTRGTVYGLRRAGIEDPIDYVGFAINLASRLQTYCRDLGFIASARLMLKDADRAGWLRLTTRQLRGFGPEDIYVDRGEYRDLNDKVKTALFKERGAA